MWPIVRTDIPIIPWRLPCGEWVTPEIRRQSRDVMIGIVRGVDRVFVGSSEWDIVGQWHEWVADRHFRDAS